ncbi:MAG: DUF3592 domain-containing protein [Betaproteobacteria bacterium]|nr:DUF3592 domain-containing protein [Betaproteobacteria bacterium]
MSLYSVISTVAGLAALGHAAWLSRTILRLRSWKSVDGRIASVRFVKLDIQGGHQNYSAIVEYDYSVAGRRYHGDRIRLGGLNPMRAEGIQEFLRTFAEGATVPVYYDPVSPGDAVLVLDWNGGTVLASALIGFLALTVAFFTR